MIEADLITLVQAEVMDLANRFDSDDYANAIDDAERETGWTLPLTENFKLFWIKRRVKRHLFYMLLTKYADKFKYEGANLQHRFEHFWKLVADEDEAFEKAQNNQPQMFAAVSTSQLFGHKIDAGFAYDRLGQDVTYDGDNQVVISPSDTD